jgi:hypothetical protein
MNHVFPRLYNQHRFSSEINSLASLQFYLSVAFIMFNLPVELQRHCVQYLDVATLKSLRTVNKSILALATEALFHTVSLFHHDESATRYTQILEDSKLSPLVRKVVFDTSNSENEHLDGNEEKDLNEEFRVAMRVVGKFENLCEVELKFSDECAAEDMDWEKEVQETVEFRTRVLKKFFKSLNIASHPALKVESLTVDNLQDHTLPEIYENENFVAVRSRLKSLALRIATETDDASPESSIHMSACHEMFNKNLIEHWLKPLQSQLTQLTIYCDTYWGVFPYCDLRQVRFPQLKSLSLGNFSIVHHWQIDWILSHGSTLEELVLDDCPIVITLKVEATLWNENFPEPMLKFRNANANAYVTAIKDIAIRWYEIFSCFRKELPNLRKFVTGHGKWAESVCFKERYELLPALIMGRYILFDIGIGPSQWIEFDHNRTYKTDIQSWGREEISFPDTDELDMKALEELVDVVEIRNRSYQG